ncbi:hypothetical protein BN2364_1694 [Alloalcanivorax xenomutans]|nr:hypothetical protein BN2364_1694 [Alloalcanivorax xenomutans]
MRVVTGRRVVLHVGGRDRNTTLTLFRGVIDLIEGARRTGAPHLEAHPRQSGRQRRLTMVNVTNRAHVYVRFITFKLFLCHGSIPLQIHRKFKISYR